MRDDEHLMSDEHEHVVAQSTVQQTSRHWSLLVSHQNWHINKPLRPLISVAVVIAVSSAMFVVSATTAQVPRQPLDLVQLAQVEAGQVAAQAEQVDALRAEVNELAADTGVATSDIPTRVTIASGATAVQGPGVTVTLDDAPTDAWLHEDVEADLLVVHQQDIESVVNALWAGGAEAVAVQGQRLISTSGIRCVGNVLRIHGQVYSPPYVITAIGDADQLRLYLDSSAAVSAYRRDAAQLGLGWSVTTGNLTVPAFSGATDLQYATAVTDDEGQG